MRMLPAILPALLLAVACSGTLDVPGSGRGGEALADQARREYLEPIRPGDAGRNPWWNGYAPRFLYAPAFNLPAVADAVRYRFTLTVTPVEGEAQNLSFEAERPTASLAAVWNDILPGKVRLTVLGLDREGQTAGLSGVRSFVRDVPFQDGYPEAARPYRDAAVAAARFAHGLPAIQSWKNATVPDMSLPFNAYPCKTIGSTVRMECLVARLCPELSEEALAIARHAAAFLIAQSRPASATLAYFPPTYYGTLLTAGRAENIGKTMMMEAVTAGDAFLDLYAATGETQYLLRAVGIANTYLRLQAADGSFPIKVDFVTGEAVNGSHALLTPLMEFWARLDTEFGMGAYRDGLRAAEEWMDRVPVETFDWTGQFEDVSVNVEPYSNLTDCTAAPYASWILRRGMVSEKAREDARDLIRLCEDQFVHWDEYVNAKWNICPPCVFEQFHYQTPVDNSACVVANAWLDWYLLTGDRLSLTKAKALVDNIVNVQNPSTGEIPTTWDEYPSRASRNGPWINCLLNSVNTLLRMENFDTN
ncbi:MAG: hypothetical protein IJ721_01080 [Bacteroidales bacterium]|nr:hypothetical protein [Bacteroidales bacterium]